MTSKVRAWHVLVLLHVVLVVALLGIAVAAAVAQGAAWPTGSATANLLPLGLLLVSALVLVMFVRWWRRLPFSRRTFRAYRALDAAIRVAPGGALLRSGDVTLMCHDSWLRPAVTRYAEDSLTLPVGDEVGMLAGERFSLTMFPSLVVRSQFGDAITLEDGPDGLEHDVRQDDSPQRSWGEVVRLAAWGSRTGMLFASADELESLVAELSVAEVVDDNPDQG